MKKDEMAFSILSNNILGLACGNILQTPVHPRVIRANSTRYPFLGQIIRKQALASLLLLLKDQLSE